MDELLDRLRHRRRHPPLPLPSSSPASSPRCRARRLPPLRDAELVDPSPRSTPERERGRASVERKRGKATTGRGAATSSSSPPPLFLAPGERNVEHRRGFLPTATPVAAHFLRLSAAASLPSAGRERRKERERGELESEDRKKDWWDPLKGICTVEHVSMFLGVLELSWHTRLHKYL